MRTQVFVARLINVAADHWPDSFVLPPDEFIVTVPAGDTVT